MMFGGECHPLVSDVVFHTVTISYAPPDVSDIMIRWFSTMHIAHNSFCDAFISNIVV